MNINPPTTEKHLDSSFDFIQQMGAKDLYHVVSDYPTIDGISVLIEGAEKGFSFEAQRTNQVPGGGAQFQNQFYGFTEQFWAFNDNRRFFLPRGIWGASMSFDTGITRGSIGSLDAEYYLNAPLYHRLIIINRLHHSTMARHIESERLRVGQWLTGAGFVNVSIGENIYHFFKYGFRRNEGENNDYYFIDSTAPILAEDFERVANSILYSAAFITGELPRDSFYIIQSSDNLFKNVCGARFKTIESSVDTHLEVVSPSLLRDLNMGKSHSGYVSQREFSVLVSLVQNDERMMRALKIVLESGRYPLEIQGATYCVALETLKSIVLEDNASVSKPIKEKAQSRKVVSRLKEVINEFDENIFNNKNVIISKIEHINQPANSAGFAACFSYLGMQLQEEEEDVLNRRNEFLHGRLPFEAEFNSGSSQELRFIVHKLHLLLSMLVLKRCGYQGYLKDNANYYKAVIDKVFVPPSKIFRAI